MKKALFLFLLLLCISCAKENKSATIHVNTTAVDFVEIKSPIDDITLWDNKTDTIYPNEQHEFLFTKEIDQPEFVTIIIGKTRLKSILLPGKEIQINSLDSTYVFEGTNKVGMQFLNAAKRPFFDITESNKFKNDSTAIQVQEKIKTLKKPELDKLEAFILNKEIDTELAKILQKEIDYFYAQRTAQIITVNQYTRDTIAADLIRLFDETVTEFPLETTYKPSSWEMYTETVLKEKALYDAMATGMITKDSLQKFYTEDKLHPFYYQLIHSYKDASVVEKVAAQYIMNASKQDRFEKSLITIFDQFKEDFPNSVYTTYLTTSIRKISRYHVKISGKMPDNVQFYENENVASLDDLLKDLKGDKYYVDLWATWCGPCKKEFKHNDALNVLLKSKGYKKLYISLDKPQKREKWKQDIKYFDLSGLHLLASQEFFADFEKKHSLHEGYVSIPQYLIVDKNGTLVTNNAPRPSDLNKLRTLLDQ
jgi:thiol-disulfide isomerase/thioredoxin